MLQLHMLLQCLTSPMLQLQMMLIQSPTHHLGMLHHPFATSHQSHLSLLQLSLANLLLAAPHLPPQSRLSLSQPSLLANLPLPASHLPFALLLHSLGRSPGVHPLDQL
jgi:hypothetical protein